MWSILIARCFLLTHLCLSIPIRTNNEFDHYQQINDSPLIDHNNNNLLNLSPASNNTIDNPVLNICSIQSINIDPPQQRSTKTTTIHFISSWEQKIVANNSHEDHNHAISTIQIIFTIPYNISNESILNKTIFITDVTHKRLLASITDFCYNQSSFDLKYSTIQPLPHDVCLYLLLNLTSSSSIFREIIFCRTIENASDHISSSSPSNESITPTKHAVGPSGFFILSQCIIILIMMFIIYSVQTAREKSLVNRVSQRLIQSRPYITIFGNKTIVRSSTAAVNTTLAPATTLQAGLRHIAFHRHLVLAPAPIEEQVLAATDRTSTMYDRRATRPTINRDLIDVEEFTKRISIVNNSPTDVELHPI